MRSLVVTATALTMICGAALAQTSTSGSTSGANVDTSSGSNSSSVSNPKVNVYGNPIGNGASSSNSSANTRSNSNSRSGAAASSGQSSSTSGVIINNTTSSGSSGSSGGTDAASGTTAAGTTTSPTNYTSTQTLRNTPEIVAPSIVGGNPCTVGMSGGVALPGFGIVTGGSWEGKACERRQLAALLYNMGHDIPGAKGGSLEDAAVEVLCVDVAVREAMRRIGQPCVADRGMASNAPSSMATPAPVAYATPKKAPTKSSTPIAMAAPVTQPVATSAPAVSQRQIPDWCYTATAEQRRANKSCGG